MTREEAKEILTHNWTRVDNPNYSESELDEAFFMAIEALSADAVSREEAIQAIDRCRERKNKEIEQLREFYSQKPTIPTFAESEEAYKAWTGEEMGKTGDEINEMNMEIIKDILKMMPTAYLLEALGVSTFEELTEPTDKPHGEWNKTTDGNGWSEWYVFNCPFCDATIEDTQSRKWEYNYCPNCGAKMGGDVE